MDRAIEDVVGAGGRKQLMCALVAGDPHPEGTVSLMRTIVEAGADMLELIVPFSDPAYHGPVIQRACERARREGVGWETVQEILAAFRETHAAPVVVSSYYNRILAFGLERFSALVESLDSVSVMVADLPWEESRELRDSLEGTDVPLIPTVAPTTSTERMKSMVDGSEAFFVWTGHAGGEVTLSQRDFRTSMETFDRVCDRPIFASMKISTGEEAATVVEHADGVLVGSALIWLVEGRDADLEDRIADFVGDLRGSLDGESED